MSHLQMQSILAGMVIVMASVAHCAPGGYTGLGGLYKNMNQKADYMDAAKHAAKMAVNLFEDESLVLTSESRPARQSVYVPTFFTNQPQPQTQAAQGQLQQLNRPSRDAQVTDRRQHNV